MEIISVTGQVPVKVFVGHITPDLSRQTTQESEIVRFALNASPVPTPSLYSLDWNGGATALVSVYDD